MIGSGNANPARLLCAGDAICAIHHSRGSDTPAGRLFVLHAASAAGTLTMVELLLRLGAEPNVTDGGGHTPLYSVGNECATAGGGVCGSRVGSQRRKGGCARWRETLHRASHGGEARQGRGGRGPAWNVVRTSNRETVLAIRRCGAPSTAARHRVAALLVARGADLHSKGSKGLTPLLAARSAAMIPPPSVNYLKCLPKSERGKPPPHSACWC